VLRRFRLAVELAIAVAAVAALAVRVAPARVGAQSAPAVPPELIGYPDLIITNGKILTVDKEFSIKQAMAIRDGKILALGTNQAIERLAGPKTERMDLAGKSVIPGMIDTHLHGQGAAIRPHLKEIQAIEPKYRDYTDTATVTGSSVAEVLENIKKVCDQRAPGTWVGVELGSPEMVGPFWDKVRRQDLDKVSPNSLLVVHTRGLYYIMNTKVVQAMKDFYGFMPEEYELDSTGLLNGRVDVVLMESIIGDMMFDHPMQSLYPALKDYLMNLASYGLTTDSGRVIPFWYQPIYREMEKRHDMAIRFTYSALGTQVFQYASDFYRRLGNVTDMGSDMLWIGGAGVVHIDGANPQLCTTLAPNNPCMARNPTDLKRKALFEAVKYGNRVMNTHVSGDLAADQLMDVIEEASKAAGMTPEEIQAKHHVMDHCTLNPRPDQIERGKKLGIIWACAATAVEGASEVARLYGEEYANKWVAPVQSILKAGGHVAGHGEGMRGDSYFTNLEELLTRKDSKGRIWGANDAVDRKDLLRMYTIWAADYVGRPDRLGSLEPGKFADLAILDKDYMTLPNDQFHTMHAITTMVGGKVVWKGTGGVYGRATDMQQ
jgi:predicted amidohydrolase YtcJ